MNIAESVLADLVRQIMPQPRYDAGCVFDEHNRLIAYPGKMEVAPPKPTRETMVWLIAGQSNAANSGGQRYRSKAFNWCNGRCFRAESPLLGSTGASGEPWSLLADQFPQVILVPAAVGGTGIDQWQAGGPLNEMLLGVVADLPYTVTHVLWHQGEEDFVNRTNDYRGRFLSMVDSLRQAGVSAPVFVSVATRCGLNPEWSADNPISMAQRALPDGVGIFAGPDTDILSGLDRFEDRHFSAIGLAKCARAWFDIISTYEARNG